MKLKGFLWDRGRSRACKRVGFFQKTNGGWASRIRCNPSAHMEVESSLEEVESIHWHNRNIPQDHGWQHPSSLPLLLVSDREDLGADWADPGGVLRIIAIMSTWRLPTRYLSFILKVVVPIDGNHSNLATTDCLFPFGGCDPPLYQLTRHRSDTKSTSLQNLVH